MSCIQEDGVCNHGDLKLSWFPKMLLWGTLINISSGETKEEMSTNTWLSIGKYSKFICINQEEKDRTQYYSKRKLAKFHLLRINKITKWRSRPLSVHLCGVRHLYHSWCDLQVPLGLVNWKIQMPWNPKSRIGKEKQNNDQNNADWNSKKKKKKLEFRKQNPLHTSCIKAPFQTCQIKT